jgi:transposase InsO family protein
MPPSYRQANSSGYAVKAGEVNGYKVALFEYIEIFYNRKRRHSGIGYRTPAQAHAEMLIKAAA